MSENAAINGKDTTSDKRIVVVLRQVIIDGKLIAGEKISEVGVSKLFTVSRTPARLALRALEVEGLIQKRDGRGYSLLKLNFSDLSKAYEVRGVLEGLAAGSLAKSNPSKKVLKVLHTAISDMATAIASSSVAMP
ncbi:MAG: GntR family transcriptional regulator [Amylibacter sp.]